MGEVVGTGYVERGKQAYVVVEVESDTRPGTIYRVDISNQRCSCPAWKFAKAGADGKRPPCRHLKDLAAKGVA